MKSFCETPTYDLFSYLGSAINILYGYRVSWQDPWRKKKQHLIETVKLTRKLIFICCLR